MSIFIGPPPSEDKEKFSGSSRRALILRSPDADPAALAPLIHQLKPAPAAS
jgi:hypothetical protein